LGEGLASEAVLNFGGLETWVAGGDSSSLRAACEIVERSPASGKGSGSEPWILGNFDWNFGVDWFDGGVWLKLRFLGELLFCCVIFDACWCVGAGGSPTVLGGPANNPVLLSTRLGGLLTLGP